MIYNWLVDLLGYSGSSSSYNSTILQISGFFIVMTYVIGVDLLIQAFRALFKR